jgi:type VI secretion system secreted protein Hcp
MARFVNGSWRKFAGSWAWWSAALVLLYALPMLVVNGAMDIFLKFDGEGVAAPETKGESTVKGFEDMIPLRSFTFGIENSVSIGSKSGGAGAGKASFKPVDLVKDVDKATPSLIQTLALGGHYDKAFIYVRKSGSAGTAADSFLIYELRMVAVESADHHIDGEEATEHIRLQYGALRLQYRPMDSKTGKAGTPVDAVWSQIRNDASTSVE